jgi:hypothetical protein
VGEINETSNIFAIYDSSVTHNSNHNAACTKKMINYFTDIPVRFLLGILLRNK